jgi:4-coumarate--CoA ligase
MPFDSRWTLTTPQVSIPTFLFGSPDGSSTDGKKILLDCGRPNTHSFSLTSLRDWSKRLAAGLVTAGIKPGDRVTLISGNSFWTPVLVMGVLMAGAIYNCANPASTARELAYQLKDCEPRLVLAADNTMKATQEAAREAGIDPKRIFLFADLPAHFSTASKQRETAINGNTQHWGVLLATPAEGRAFAWESDATPDISNRTAVLIYSSGTTGFPKGVELTHNNLMATTMQMIRLRMSNTDTSQHRGLCVLPMYHGLGLIYFVFVSIKSGAQSYIMERYNLQHTLECIQKFRITELILVPPIVLAMAKHPSIRNGDYDLSSVKRVLAGAAPLGMEVTQQFEEIWKGKVRVRQAWGLTEYFHHQA